MRSKFGNSTPIPHLPSPPYPAASHSTDEVFVAPAWTVVLAVVAAYRPRPITTTKSDPCMIRRSLNVAMAGIKRWCIGVHFSNVGDTDKMAVDEVVTFAASQLSRSVIADCVAVSMPSIDIAYSPKANCMAGPIRQAEQVAEPVHIHGVPPAVRSGGSRRARAANRLGSKRRCRPHRGLRAVSARS